MVGRGWVVVDGEPADGGETGDVWVGIDEPVAPVVEVGCWREPHVDAALETGALDWIADRGAEPGAGVAVLAPGSAELQAASSTAEMTAINSR